MILNWIKKIAYKSLVPEILLTSLVVILFDVVFVTRFSFNIYFGYWIIALFNVGFVAGLLSLIKSNKKRYRALVIYLFLMLVLFVANSTLYFFKSDINSIATFVEMFKSSMRVGLKYNPFTAYGVITWIGIVAFFISSILFLKKLVFSHDDSLKKRGSRIKYILVITLFIFFVSPQIVKEEDAYIFDTPQDKTLFVKRFGSMNFFAKDIIVYASNIVDPLIRADEYRAYLDELFKEKTVAPQSELFGALNGQNIIMIMCETCENYAFDRDLTPNYYRLFDQSLVYSNAFSAAKRNYTYDAEFKALTSMMYSGLDNYMYTFGKNTYRNALPYILGEHDYTTRSFHNYYETFFNRNIMHPNMGFDAYLAMEALDILPTDYWPLDSWMFDQMIEKMVPIQEQPFFSFILTVTPHGPHNHIRSELEPYYELIEAHGGFEDHEESFRTFLAAQMDFDKGLGILLDYLEENDLFEETTIMLFSDHKNYSSMELTEKYKDNSDIPYEVEKIPFMIYSSKLPSGFSDIYTSHYDVTPTFLDLLGISYYSDFYYGQSLFLSQRQDLPILLTHSRWITESYRVMEDEVVLGALDELLFGALKDEIYLTFIKYEYMFKSNYFDDKDTFIKTA